MRYLKWSWLLIVPLLVFGYDNLVPPPEETGGFITWLFSSIKTLSGASSTVILAFVITALIGIFKLTPLQKYWDKLGKWKLTIPLFLGAVVEILLNMPHPFAWDGFLTQLLAGALGTGTVSIALHHIWKEFFAPKPVV